MPESGELWQGVPLPGMDLSYHAPLPIEDDPVSEVIEGLVDRVDALFSALMDVVALNNKLVERILDLEDRRQQ